MIKNYFYLFTIAVLFFTSSLFSVCCSPELRSYVETIEKLPEAKELIAAVQKEGLIIIKSNHSSLSGKFGAYWDCEKREININTGSGRSDGAIIGSILFELHNALVNSEWDRLDRLAMQRKIDRNSYIRDAEYLEYQNSLACAKLAEKGIQRGLYPNSARLHTYRDFEEHFYYQNVSGHSQVFARNYDCLSS